MARRTRLAPAARREQLLEAARLAFELRPYEEVSLEGIAESAGVSPALVHHYLGTKREVFMALVVQAVEGFQAAVDPGSAADEAPSAPAPPEAALRAAVGRYLDFVLERPNGYAFVIGAHGAPDLAIRRMIDTAREVVHRRVLAIVGITEPTPEQDLAMWGWLGFVERATTRWVARGGGERETLVELLMVAAAPVLPG